MMTSFADVIAHLASRFTLSGGGPSWVELWWKLTVDGERVVQHQRVHVEEVAAGLAIRIGSDVHCRDPRHVRWDEMMVSVGALGFDRDRPVLWQPVVGADVDAAHLARVMEAVAIQAARLARLARASAA